MVCQPMAFRCWQDLAQQRISTGASFMPRVQYFILYPQSALLWLQLSQVAAL